jgi:hypothetical protein
VWTGVYQIERVCKAPSPLSRREQNPRTTCSSAGCYILLVTLRTRRVETTEHNERRTAAQKATSLSDVAAYASRLIYLVMTCF